MEEETRGRPSIITPEIISKLEEVFAIGGSDEEACFYADIGKSTLYNYQKEHPEFVERKEALKEKPVLKARQTVVKSLDNPDMALKYLERKKRKEFATRVEQQIDEHNINITWNNGSSDSVYTTTAIPAGTSEPLTLEGGHRPPEIGQVGDGD